MEIASFVLRKSAPSADYATDARIFVMIMEYTWTAQLIDGVGDERYDAYLYKNTYSSDLDLAISLLKYEISLCIFAGPYRLNDIVW